MATLSELIAELELVGNKLRLLGPDVSYKLDLGEETSSLVTKNPLNPLPLQAIVNISALPTSSLHIESLTREKEGGLAFGAKINNIFGGAENLNLLAAFGTRPRSKSSYSFVFDSPFQGSGLWRLAVGGQALSETISWASHSRVIQGIELKLNKNQVKEKSNLDINFGINVVNRTVLGIGAAASDSIRAAAGDSIKNSIFASYKHSCQDKSINPSRGFSIEASTEYAAGRNGLLPGDVQFFKGSAAASVIKSVMKDSDRFVMSFGGSFGLLLAEKSTILDRFYIGGLKKDGPQVYGFEYNQLGPKDDSDAIGGDAYVAGDVKLYSKLPGMCNSPLRALVLFNGASLVGLDKSMNVQQNYQQLMGSFSSAVGVGLSYKVPQAQLELMYNVPTRQQSIDTVRRGWQFGVSLSV